MDTYHHTQLCKLDSTTSRHSNHNHPHGTTQVSERLVSSDISEGPAERFLPFAYPERVGEERNRNDAGQSDCLKRALFCKRLDDVRVFLFVAVHESYSFCSVRRDVRQCDCKRAYQQHPGHARNSHHVVPPRNSVDVSDRVVRLQIDVVEKVIWVEQTHDALCEQLTLFVARPQVFLVRQLEPHF